MVRLSTSPCLVLSRGAETQRVAAINLAIPRSRLAEFAAALDYLPTAYFLTSRQVELANASVDVVGFRFHDGDLESPVLLAAIHQFAVPNLTRVSVTRSRRQEWSLSRFLREYTDVAGSEPE